MRGYLDALDTVLRGVQPLPRHERLRLTVTGSREGWEFTPAPLVQAFDLIYAWQGRMVRLGHGRARGVDMAADRLGRALGWQVMPYPVSQRDWDTYGKQAGHIRNARMLEAEQPHLVLALIWRGSRGSTGCADNATARGIPVVRIDEELALIPRASAML